MSRHNIKIKQIIFDNDRVIIKSDNNLVFISKIVKGSINFKIYNSMDEEINFGHINEGEYVKIFGKKDNNDILNSIEIQKIIIMSKYKFNSDTDDSEDFIN